MSKLVSRFRTITQALCLVGMAAMVGCGGGDFASDVVKDNNKTNVQKVANCYAMFQFSNKFNGPKNLEEFKEFLSRPKNAGSLTSMGIDPADIDGLFVSERDGEPIVIRWGVKTSSRGSNEPVTFEATGVGGTRLVGFTSSMTKEISDAAEYDTMLAGKFVADNPNAGGGAPEDAANAGRESGVGDFEKK